MMPARPTALVTGAGRRLGQAIAVALGARGMHVVVHYHASDAGARATAQAIDDAGGSASLVQADLRDPAAIDPLLTRTLESTGTLDVLVNSAAEMVRTPVGEVTVAQWDALFGLNLRAPFFLAQAAAPHLRRVHGCIVNIADIAADETWPGFIPYSTTKAGLAHMTRALARALAPDVRVNAVAPGAVQLPDDFDDAMASRLAETTPLGRLGTPSDVVGAVLYLLDAGYVTGQVLAVDGGRLIRA
ncbi:MAG: SDR family oxidoreductase [Gemmatimonadaceae bacterium]|nr:SDR family oxidoreductase [Gemmatimonadaceae bacterium]